MNLTPEQLEHFREHAPTYESMVELIAAQDAKDDIASFDAADLPLDKYQRVLRRTDDAGTPHQLILDVYDFIVLYKVTCPARQHALKKILMPGGRGLKSAKQDLEEAIQAIQAIQRAIELLPAEYPA